MRTVRSRLGLTLAVVLLGAACSGAPGSGSPSIARATSATPAPEPAAAPTGSPGADGAALVLRATGSGTACASFASFARCVVFFRVQPVGGAIATDVGFAGNPLGTAALAPAEGAPQTLAPGAYRITAHLDRVATDSVLPPATPQHWVDRTCHADVTVTRATTKVSARIRFDDGDSCSVKITPETKASAKPTKKP